MSNFAHIFNTVPRITFDTPKELMNKTKILELIKQYCMKHKFEYKLHEQENSYYIEFKYHENRDSVAEYLRGSGTLIG